MADSRSLEGRFRSEIGRKLLHSEESRWGFFRRGMIIACLFGRKVPCRKEQLIMWRKKGASKGKESDMARKLIGSAGENEILVVESKERISGRAI